MMPSGVSSALPQINIRVSGQLFHAHLNYLDQMIQSAVECELWAMLDLTHLVEVDREALLYLINGEGRDFGIAACPGFVREWMEHEQPRKAA
jgi:hypothetical protein